MWMARKKKQLQYLDDPCGELKRTSHVSKHTCRWHTICMVKLYTWQNPTCSHMMPYIVICIHHICSDFFDCNCNIYNHLCSICIDVGIYYVCVLLLYIQMYTHTYIYNRYTVTHLAHHRCFKPPSVAATSEPAAPLFSHHPLSPGPACCRDALTRLRRSMQEIRCDALPIFDSRQISYF